MKVLVTGKNGQLGQELRVISKYDNDAIWSFYGKKELDITSWDNVEVILLRENPDVVVNCAAYTKVDQAEKEQKEAYSVNVAGTKNLALMTNRIQARYIHISTDFVFDGSKTVPYLEDDATHPLNVYGATKLESEQQVLKYSSDCIILRVSWLYSIFGNNFVKTILRLASENGELKVVMDQVGSPTAACDVAEVIKLIIHSKNLPNGIYHYSNEGVASWYDFACAILEFTNRKADITAIHSEDFPQIAKRPHYTVFNKTKIKSVINLDIPHWRKSLERVLNEIRR